MNGWMQDQIAVIGAGALEMIVAAVTSKISEWCFDAADTTKILI